MNANKTIGILGGMGPEATVHLFSLVVGFDKAERDQDHLKVIVLSNPTVPDRTAYLLGAGEDPRPVLKASARLLQEAGAQIAGIPCMTAHAFLRDVREGLAMEFVSAFELLAERLRAEPGSPRRIGVLATSGSKKAKLYENHLPGFDILWPDEDTQMTCVMEAIYGKDGIKAGNRGEMPKRLLATASERLAAAGAQVIIAGCTEVPLALTQADLAMTLVDPMELLAKALVARARGA